jgi:hypothetical protein
MPTAHALQGENTAAAFNVSKAPGDCGCTPVQLAHVAA